MKKKNLPNRVPAYNRTKTPFEQMLAEVLEETDKDKKAILLQKFGISAPILTEEEEKQCKN